MAVLIASTPVGLFAFLADAADPAWLEEITFAVRLVPDTADWHVIPIPDGHGPRVKP